jgi:hypothetical protein
LYGDPADPNIYTGNPFQFAQDQNNFLVPPSKTWGGVTLGHFAPYIPMSPEDTSDVQDTKVDTYITNLPVDFDIPFDLEIANDYNRYQIKDAPTVPEVDQGADALLGIVKDQVNGSIYNVQLFGKSAKVQATQLLIGDGQVIPPDTPAYLIRIKGSYYMQVPVWLVPPS